MMVMAAVTSHAAISSAGEPRVRLMSSRDNENARPDHRAHHDGGRGKEPHALHELGLRGGALGACCRGIHVPFKLSQNVEKVPRRLLNRLARREERGDDCDGICPRVDDGAGVLPG